MTTIVNEEIIINNFTPKTLSAIDVENLNRNFKNIMVILEQIENAEKKFNVFIAKYLQNNKKVLENHNIDNEKLLKLIKDAKEIIQILNKKFCTSEHIYNQNDEDSTEYFAAYSIENLNSLGDFYGDNSGQTNNNEDNSCEEELYIPDQQKNEETQEKEIDKFNFDNIKNNLFYFINIISKDNINFKNDEINNIRQKISNSLKIINKNIYIVQNNRINDFVKSFNYEEISLEQIKFQPIISKFDELKSLKNELLINEYHMNKNLFDNNGNFLTPNSRKNLYRGKEIYYPPYDWIGIGLNVLNKYKDDKWLNDISNESEWAIAYRGIGRNVSSDDVKKYLNYFILKDLNIAVSSVKSLCNDKRHWDRVKEGIYLTPYIDIAEKYTQSIIFKNKKYKVLLMAKVKTDKIRQPEGTHFWVLNNDDIRIYRILFKNVD